VLHGVQTVSVCGSGCLTYNVCVADNVCLRPWAFERVHNKMIRGLDNVLIYTSTKETCLAACLNEVCELHILYLAYLSSFARKIVIMMCLYVFLHISAKKKINIFTFFPNVNLCGHHASVSVNPPHPLTSECLNQSL
jgi:hypothetical protein